MDLESSPDEISELQLEIAIQSGCSNKRIAQYLDSFVRKHKLFIVMEYLGGGSGRDLVCLSILCAGRDLAENGTPVQPLPRDRELTIL